MAVERIPRDVLVKVARERQERSRGAVGDAKGRPLSENYWLVGLVGEEEFGFRFGLPTDLTWRPGGDNGIDFTLADGTIVDVKTARKARNLLREADKPHVADILVLARYHEDMTAALLGWQFDDIVTRQPPVRWPQDIVNHVVPASLLRPMAELEALCGLVDPCLVQAGFAEWEAAGDDRWTR